MYSSFFQIYAQHTVKPKVQLKKTKAVVMIHPRDELVSFKKIKCWVESETNWDFVSLENKKARFRRYNHLCFDEDTLGVESYKKMISKIHNFLED